MEVLKSKCNKRFLKSEILDDLGFVKHIFSTRDFGNQGLHVGDNREIVLSNRKKLSDELNVDSKTLVAAEQVHGTKVARVFKENIGRGALDYNDSLKGYDGLITNVPNVPLFAFFADCVPIFLADYDKKAIGIVHAGWKGTLGNIAGKSISSMKKEFGSNPKDIVAVIGPHIGVDCYEVSQDIIAIVQAMDVDSNYFIKDNHIDLGLIIKWQLENIGLLNIELDDHCTSCNLDLFYSHRKESGKTGRMAGMILIEGE